MRAVSLISEGQPVSELFEKPPHIRQVEVYVVGEVDANVGVSVHQSAVESSPSQADHHGDQTQQQQDQARVPAHFL